MRFSRRAKRRIIVLAASVALAGAGVVVFKMVHTTQQARLIQQARDAGMEAYEQGDFNTALDRLGYVIQHDKRDPEVILAFADARARTPMPNSKHIFEAMSYYKAGVELLRDPSVTVPASMDRDAKMHDSWARLLDLYRVHGLKFEVRATAEKLLEHDPDNVDALIALAQMSYLDREFEQALELTQRLIELQPEQLKWRKLYLGLLSQSDRSMPELVEQCERWNEQGAEDGRYHALQAAVLHDGGRFNEAREAIALAAEQGAGSPDVLREMVSLLDAFGMTSVADELIERTNAQHSDAQWVQLAIARRYWQANKIDAALSKISEVERRFDELDPELVKLKALVLASSGQDQQAIETLQPLTGAAEQYDREDEALRAWANAVIARLRSSEHEYEQIIQTTEHALLQEPRDPVLHTILGETYSKMGEDSLAVQHYQRAYRLDPSWIAAGVTYIESLLRTGQTVDAYLTAAKVLQRRPTDMLPPYLLCARAYLDLKRSGQFSDVTAMGGPTLDITGILEVIYERVPDDPRVSAMLAEAYVLDGRRDLAEQFISAAMQSDDTSAAALTALARVVRRYEMDSEQGLLERAASLNPASIDVALAQADWLARRGEPDKGLQVIDAAIERAPAEVAQSFETRRARTAYLLRIDHTTGLQAMRQLVQDFPDNAAAQSFALARSETWSDQTLVRETIDRLSDVVGRQAQQVRLAEANYLLRYRADEEADLARAIVLVNGVLEESSDSLAALTLLANAAMLGERPSVDRAVTHLSRAVERYPNATSLYPALIDLLQQQGDYSTAERYLNRFARLTERQPQWKDEEVRLLRAQGQFEQALVRASSLIDEQSGETDQLMLAEMYRRSGRQDDAERVFQRLLEKPNPGATVIERAAEFYAVNGRLEQSQVLLNEYEPPADERWRKHLLLGRFEMRYGTPADAERHLRKAVTLGPNQVDAHYELARHHLSRDLHQAALDSAMQGLKAQPEHSGLRAVLALAALNAGRAARDRAVAFWDELGVEDQAIEDMLSLLQSVEVRAGRLRPSQRDLDEAQALVSRHGQFLPAWMLCIAMHSDAGRMNEAIDTARRAVGRFPADAQVARWATNLLMQAERWSTALTEAQEWRRRSLHDPIDADVAIATVLLELGRASDALKQLDRHSERIMAERASRPHRVGPWLRVLLANGAHERASEAASTLISQAPRWRKLWMDLSREMSADQAYAALSAVESEATEPREYLELAVAWNRLGQRRGEQSYFARADALAVRAGELEESLHEQMLITRGLIAEAQDDLVKAERYYRQVIDQNPDNVMTLNNLAYLLVRNGRRYEQALPLVERAVELAPDHPALLDTYGQVLMGLGRLEDAEDAFAEARSKRPNDIGIGLNLTEVLIRRGTYREASFVLEDVREAYETSWPKDPEAARRMERLRNQINDQVGQAGS